MDPSLFTLAQYQSPPVDPKIFKEVVDIIAWIFMILCGGGGIGFGLHMKAKLKRQSEHSGTQETVPEAVTRREFDELKATIEKRFDALSQERKESSNHIHNQIEALGKRLEAKLDVIDNRFEAGNERMTEHGERIAKLEAQKGGRNA